MRLWSIHPKYLDSKGLVALWREGLLAQAVLLNRTKGYTFHPQLQRFRTQPDPVASIGCYLWYVAAEAKQRGYDFQEARIEIPEKEVPLIPVTDQQLAFELAHLRHKLETRNPRRLIVLDQQAKPHPLFLRIDGPIEDWERAR